MSENTPAAEVRLISLRERLAEAEGLPADERAALLAEVFAALETELARMVAEDG